MKMNLRSTFAAVALCAGALALTTSADAKELREGRAHVALDVPDSWDSGVDGNRAWAHPKDDSFHLHLYATEHDYRDDNAAADHALTFLNKHFDNVQWDHKAKHLDFNNFRGMEAWGTGTEKNGGPGKFFILFLQDKRDHKRAVVAVGTGTPEGFEKHSHGIREAFQTLRTW